MGALRAVVVDMGRVGHLGRCGVHSHQEDCAPQAAFKGNEYGVLCSLSLDCVYILFL